MGLYNILFAKLKCPRCVKDSKFEIESYFGFKNQIDYKIGNKVQWFEGNSVKNGARPENGNIISEGYAECPLCGKDFFVNIFIENDIIVKITSNKEKKPYL